MAFGLFANLNHAGNQHLPLSLD